MTKNASFAKSEVILLGNTSHQKLTHYVDNENSDNEEAFFIHAIRSPASQPGMVICTVNNSHKVTFEIDTGASCNILPLLNYIKATGDKKCALISPTKTCLTMHNNSKVTPLGKVVL